ncbi:MAG: hypothetical protein A2049_05010 [Elusimicrobia bacterium GWA2_62_23]|nr:MAG: hypothetical protein A2049_05010 [Elusimicrobia bacterium GWA2_62_23]HBB66168.1 hypothetical protein [Elusimicrobiota bacterium]
MDVIRKSATGWENVRGRTNPYGAPSMLVAEVEINPDQSVQTVPAASPGPPSRTEPGAKTSGQVKNTEKQK